ncbi:MAG: hypothetical protein IKO36_00795 [Bacteroidaceae bacterium]|nr:hypothetical protein [Bacteroidaceae bacterium]
MRTVIINKEQLCTFEPEIGEVFNYVYDNKSILLKAKENTGVLCGGYYIKELLQDIAIDKQIPICELNDVYCLNCGCCRSDNKYIILNEVNNVQ